jgi:hypothetical protein
MVRAIYSAGLSIYIHGITSDKRLLDIATRQRRQHAACKVFTRYTRKILYIFTEFQVSERLHRGPEFYLIYYIIITQ